MTDTRYIAFVNESGNEDLGTEKGATTLFSVAVVVLERSEPAQAEAVVAEVRERKFSGGEIKSSNVGDNVKRRRAILEMLVEMDVVDKTRVDPESGLQWKASFRKKFSRYIYEKVLRRFPDIELIVDRHGSDVFMRGFERYMQRRVEPNMFERPQFRFIEDKEKGPSSRPPTSSAERSGGASRPTKGRRSWISCVS